MTTAGFKRFSAFLWVVSAVTTIVSGFAMGSMHSDIHELEVSYTLIDNKLAVIECVLGVDTDAEPPYKQKPAPRTLTDAQRQLEDHVRWAERQERRLRKMENCLALLQARSGDQDE